MSQSDAPLIEQLSANSERYRDPLVAIDWARLDRSTWWLAPECLSLYGLPEFDALAGSVQVRLSQLELLNVAHAGLWLEGVFLARLSQALPAARFGERKYLLHELREEAGHSLMFHKLIEASGVALEPGDWIPPRFADLVARRAPTSGSLFWLATVIAEDVPDKFNRYVRRHAGPALDAVVQQVVGLHMADEARHIAFARARAERQLAAAGLIGRRALAFMANRLVAQLVDVFYFPPARFYELAGLTHGGWWRRLAQANPARRELVRQCLAPTLRLLEGWGLDVKLRFMQR